MNNIFTQSLFLRAIVFFSVLNFSFSSGINLPPSASISGNNTVCQFTNQPQVVFTGSGGDAPYTFTYTVNGGSPQTISTNGNNSSVNLGVSTNNVGTFVFELQSVEDDNGDSENASGTVTIQVLPAPDTSMGGTGSGSTFDGIPVFKSCTNTTFDFIFTNISSTQGTNTNYTIEWGDGSPNFSSSSWTTLNHTYGVGLFNLIYTIEGSNGCVREQEYIVFVGSNPAVGIGNPGNTDICNNNTLTFQINNTENNPPGTIYTVTFNDGSASEIYNHPPPANVTHTFDSSSCGTESSDGSNTFQDSFSLNIIATNPCGTSSASTLPIYISTVPEADFDVPSDTVCVNQTVCFGNTSIGDEVNPGSSCNTSPKIIWSITPSTYTLQSGSTLGNDFNLPDPATWLSGSDQLCVNFTAPGNYTITLDTGNRCGDDSVVKTICVEEPIAPQFSISNTDGCEGDIFSLDNITQEANLCTTPTYSWSLAYSVSNCGISGSWSYVNGTDETSSSPDIRFDTAGTYTITLIGTNSCGTFTNNEVIEIRKPPNAVIQTIPDSCGSASISPTANVNTCAPVTDTITYLWSFPGGSPASASTLDPGTITYTTSGTYTVTFEVTNGCGTTTETTTFEVNPIPVITNTDLDQTICSGTSSQEINLTSDQSGTTFNWTASAPATLTGYTPSGSSATIPAQVIFNSSTTTQTLTYTVTPVLGDCSGSPVVFTIAVEPAPEIIQQPLSQSVCLNGTLAPLTVAWQGTGTPTYEWFSGSSSTGPWTSLGVNSDTYLPPSDTLGTTYYYCEISFSSDGCGLLTSDVVSIEVVEGLQVDTQPLDAQSICVDGQVSALSVAVSGGAGTISYQWFSNTTGSTTGGTPIAGETNSSYSPPAFTSTGDYYYYVEISISGNGCGTTSSAVAHVEVVPDPVIDTQPLPSQELCQGATPTDLEVVVSGGLGNISYQWYSNTTNNTTSGTPIAGATTSTFTPLTTIVGTQYYYAIVSQDVSGCEVVSEVAEVIVIPSPYVDVQPESSSVCLNGTPTELTISYANGTGTPTYEWFSGPSSTGPWTSLGNSSSYMPPADVLGITYYYCEITFDSGGCSLISSDVVSVEVVEGLQVDTQPLDEQSICVDGQVSTLSVAVSGGAGTISYQWFSNTTGSTTGGTPIAGETNSSYSPPAFTSTGDYYYYVEISISGNGCGTTSSAVAHVEVVSDPVIDTQPLPSQELCQGATPTDLEVVVSGGLGNLSYQWYSNTTNNTTSGTPIAGATASSFTPPTTTVGSLYYYVVATQDVSGCEVVSEVAEVIVTEAPQLTQQPQSQTICLDDVLNDLEVSFINGTGTPNYQWYVNTIPDITTGTPVGADASTFSPPAGTVGTFYYYVALNFPSGGCGEIYSNIAEIIINQVPEITNFSEIICSDNSFSVQPSDGIDGIVPANTTYTWSAPVITPAGAISGATDESSPQAEVSQLLLNTTTSPAEVVYTVTPTSGDCVGIPFTITVTVNPSISVVVDKEDITCYQDNNGSISLQITGGVPFSTGSPYQISWSGPNGFTSSQEDISGLEPGNYTVTIDDAGGCPYEETYTIVEPPELVLESIDQYSHITCYGDNDGVISLTIAGGTLPYSYNWTQNSNFYADTEDISALPPGMYQLTVTDANLCVLVLDPLEIEEPPLLTVALDSQTNIDCFGDNTGAITTDVQGGRPDYTFSWTGPDGFTSDLQNISNLFAGEYEATVTDTSGCTETLQVTLLQNNEIAIEVTQTEIRCYGDNDASITIDAITGGVSPYEIAWSNFGTGMVQDNLSAGTYTITITDALNCVRSFDIIIDEAPVFLIDPNVTQISCYGEDDASIHLNLEGGIAPVTVAWDDDPSAGVERNNLGPGTYSVTITDSSLPVPPCTIEAQFVIYEVLPLELSAVTTDALDCDEVNSGAINLSISGGTIANDSDYQVSWSNGATTQDLSAIGPGTYYVTVTDDNGCEVTGEWEILRFEPLTLSVEVESDFDCETREVSQTFVAVAQGGIPGYTYSWSSGTVSGDNNEYMQTDLNGLVFLEVTDSYGCIQSLSYNVEIPVIGFPDFSTTSIGYTSYGIYSIQDPIQFTNEATGDFESIVWDFGDGTFSSEENPVHTYVQEGSYVVTQTVTYAFGCVYEHVITLEVEKGYALIFPNAFTPNDDGLNDHFLPKYIGVQAMQLSVYDTWGSLIFSESGDTLIGWDGKLKGRYAENGNYYYTFSGQTFYGKELTSEGAFTYIK